ncbi:hypothetical protein D3C77_396670 [compost metagenome]
MQRQQQLISAINENLMLLAKLDQLFVIMKDGIGIIKRLRYVNLHVIGIDFNPRSSRSKTSISSHIPLHRGSRIVPAPLAERLHDLFFRHPIIALFLVVIQRLHITVIIDRLESDVRHSDFLTLINIWRAFQRVNKGGQHFCRRHPVQHIVPKA